MRSEDARKEAEITGRGGGKMKLPPIPDEPKESALGPSLLTILIDQRTGHALMSHAERAQTAANALKAAGFRVLTITGQRGGE